MVSSTFQVLHSMLRKRANNRHSPHLQGASNLVYYAPFNIFYYLWSERSNLLTRHIRSISYSPASSLITLRYHLHHSHPLCFSFHHCIFIHSVPYLKHSPWLTCIHQLGFNSNVAHTMKSFLILKLGASMVHLIIFCEYPNHGTSHHLFMCLSPSLDWKLLRGRDCVCVFSNLSVPRVQHCIWYIDDE